MARSLKAKPAALAARNPTHFSGGPGVPLHPSEPPPYVPRGYQATNEHAPEHGTGDVFREQATRVMNAGVAIARLKTASEMAHAAHNAMVVLVGAQHPAARAALITASDALKALQLADNVLRVLMR